MSAPLMDPVLDREVALSRVGGDVQLLKEIAVLFLTEYPKMLAELRTAVEQSDSKLLERIAHSLKGSVSNFGAGVAVEAARSLETLGRAGRVQEARQVIRTLELALAVLATELERL